MTLTGRQTLKVMQVLSARYSREITLSWTRQEFNAKREEIARELFGKI